MAGTQANPLQPAGDRKTSQAILARLARRLARSIADVVDADQWALAIAGIDHLNAPPFAESVSHAWPGRKGDESPNTTH